MSVAEPSLLECQLRDAMKSERVVRAGEMGPGRAGQVTNHQAQAVLSEAVRLLSPAIVLEIGTYFADSARLICEVMSENGGHLTTIDPFGADRVPGIIANWPKELQDKIRFLPLNSMSFFLNLETERTGIGKNAPYDVIFVDGHHAFDYAFFDMMRSSQYLKPGGLLFVDDINQGGPKQAIRRFCEHYNHWKLFTHDGSPPNYNMPGLMPGVYTGIVMAPNGIEIGALPFTYDIFNVGRSRIDRLILNMRSHGSSGSLAATVELYAQPYDLSTTGTGLVGTIAIAERRFEPSLSNKIVLTFEPPIEISPNSLNDPIHVQVTMAYTSVHPELPNLLLDPASPVEVS